MRKPIRKCFLSAYLWGNNKAGKSNWCLSLESDGRELGIPTTTMWVWTAYGKPNFHNMICSLDSRNLKFVQGRSSNDD